MIGDKRKSDFALLTRREKEWILGKIKVSKTMQRDIRYRIRKKVEVLQNEELPLLMSKRFFELEVNVNNKSNGSYISSPGVCSVVANDDGVVPNHDGSDAGGGRWSSLVKIPPMTLRKVKDNRVMPANVESKTTIKNAKWAGSDLNQRPPPRSRNSEDWLMEKAPSIFKDKVRKYSKLLDVKVEGIAIKHLKNRWGSMTKHGSVSLNVNLLKAPEDVIDYIILHELCHLKIKEHSHHYWDHVRRYMHNYQEKIEWLKISGSHLI